MFPCPRRVHNGDDFDTRFQCAEGANLGQLASPQQNDALPTLLARLQEDLGVYKPGHLSDEKLVLLVASALAARHAEKQKAPKNTLRG